MNNTNFKLYSEFCFFLTIKEKYLIIDHPLFFKQII